MATLLRNASEINHLDLSIFSDLQSKGAGAIILKALSESESLPHISQFSCGKNSGWYTSAEGDENTELLSNSIASMQSLTRLNLFDSRFSSESMSNQVVEAIANNRESNDKLKDVNLFFAIDQNNTDFSPEAKQHITNLRSKGVHIAVTEGESIEMLNRWFGKQPKTSSLIASKKPAQPRTQAAKPA